MKHNSLGKSAWGIIVAIMFCLVYLISGTFVYVDGDDASSIAYHVTGRDKGVQLPYSLYHGMMDKVLSIFPPQEGLLRTLAFTATRVANIVMVVLIFAVVFEWLKAYERHSAVWLILASLLSLLAMPELFYFGFVYAPTFVAMCFILSSHLLLRWANRQKEISRMQYRLAIGSSLLLFGFGVAFRWNTAAYGVVIVADLLFSKETAKPFRNRLAFPVYWGILALGTSFFMILLSGYGLTDLLGAGKIVLSVINQAGTLTPGSNESIRETLLRTALTLTPLFTPAFVLAFVVGVIKLVKDRNPLLYVALAGILSVLPWVKSGVPKFIITSLPTFIMIFVIGLDVLLSQVNKFRSRAVIYTILLAGLLLPWLVGIRIQRDGTAWGPGFELRQYDYTDNSGGIEITIGPGTAFPTPEGVRPLFGHAYVLLGEWKRFVDIEAEVRQNAIDKALQLDIPLVITSWSPDYYLNNLYAMGFQTSDSQKHLDENGFFYERRYKDPQGKTVSVLYYEIVGDDILEFETFIKQNTTSSKIVLIGYPRTMRAFHTSYPDAMEPIGLNCAVVDLDAIRSR